MTFFLQFLLASSRLFWLNPNQSVPFAPSFRKSFGSGQVRFRLPTCNKLQFIFQFHCNCCLFNTSNLNQVSSWEVLTRNHVWTLYFFWFAEPVFSNWFLPWPFLWKIAIHSITEFLIGREGELLRQLHRLLYKQKVKLKVQPLWVGPVFWYHLPWVSPMRYSFGSIPLDQLF